MFDTIANEFDEVSRKHRFYIDEIVVYYIQNKSMNQFKDGSLFV